MATFRRTIERREQDARRKEFMREDWVSSIRHDNVLKGSIQSEDRVDNMRRLREMKVVDEERRIQRELVENERQKMEREFLKRAEEAALTEIEADISTKLREEKMRQAIRENSYELRDLEQKINCAYMNKERSLQIKEKELMKQQKKEEDAQLIVVMAQTLERDKEEEMEKERAAVQRSIKYQQELHQQLNEIEHKKHAEYEQFLKEKHMIDEAVRKIQEEDARDMAARMQKHSETKRYIADYIKNRAAWKSEEQARQDFENRKIAEYAALQARRGEEKREKLALVEAGRGQIYEILAADMDGKERAKEELENLRIELHWEEENERLRKKEEETLAKRIRTRLEMIDNYKLQLEDKRLRLEKEQAEENKLRETLMTKFADDEKIEQISAQKRRLKQLEHKRAVDKLIEERRIKLEQEKIAELEDSAKDSDFDKYRLEVIEQERQRLLREHARKLVGYLPKGVIRDERDLELFDEDFRRKFDKMSLKKKH